MAGSPVGVAVAGCGYWGRNLVRNLHQMGNLVAVCDPDPAALEAVRATYRGIEATPDLDRILDDQKVQAVALAVPAEQHYLSLIHI